MIKSGSEGRTLYFYDPAGRLLTEMKLGETEGSAVGKDYVYLHGAPIARVDWSVPDNSGGCPPGLGTSECDPILATADLFYYHTDHLGTPVAMTNESGELVWKAEYSPFGERFSNEIAEVDNKLRFPGPYFDQETGLHQNWFRDYDPKTGRYREVDPLWQPKRFEDINPFVYATSDPLTMIDPDGLLASCGAFIIDNGFLLGLEAVRPFNFEVACQEHDKCYGGRCPVRSQDECDRLFLTTAMDDCQMRVGTARKTCELWAERYYFVLVDQGGKPYERAQREAAESVTPAPPPPCHGFRCLDNR